MTKPRKRKATTTSRKLKGKVPAKRSPSRRKSQRPATSSDDDVFIPKRVGTDAHIGASTPTTTPTDDEHADEIFVARRGRPVEVQDDWTDGDARAPLGISNDEYFASLTPRAMTPGGWTEAELREHGLEVKGDKVTCRYGCGGSTSNVPGVSAHMNACAYWQREGKHRTPFD